MRTIFALILFLSFKMTNANQLPLAYYADRQNTNQFEKGLSEGAGSYINVSNLIQSQKDLKAKKLSSPINKWTIAAAHNAFSNPDWGYKLYKQQNEGLKEQLDMGIRMLMLDTHKFSNDDYPEDVYLCHNKCSGVLGKIQRGGRLYTFREGMIAVNDWLKNNPHEVVFIDLENYVSSREIDEVLKSIPGVAKKILAPKDWDVEKKKKWPTYEWMNDNNKQIVLLSSKLPRKDGLVYYKWKVVYESAYGSYKKKKICEPRGESKPHKPKDYHIVIVNLFSSVTTPEWAISAKNYHTVENVKELVNYCQKQNFANGMLPTIIAVDFVGAEDGEITKAAARINNLR